jgi:hypothetical protein
VVDQALASAAAMLRTCNSADAAGWLQLALTAHGRPLPPVPRTRPRTTVEIALALLAQTACAGSHPFLEKS